MARTLSTPSRPRCGLSSWTPTSSAPTKPQLMAITSVLSAMLSMAAALLNWGYPGNEVIVEALATQLPDMARTELVSAVEGQYEVRSEVMANWLLGALI